MLSSVPWILALIVAVLTVVLGQGQCNKVMAKIKKDPKATCSRMGVVGIGLLLGVLTLWLTKKIFPSPQYYQ